MLALLASLAMAAQARDLNGDSCMQKTIEMDPKTFGRNAMACELDGRVNIACCDRILSLFGAGGDLELCLCDAEYYSLILSSLPSEEGVTSDSFLKRLRQCGVSFKGSDACGGGNDGPLVQASSLLKPVGVGFLVGAFGGPFRQNAYYYYYDDDDDDDSRKDTAAPQPPPSSPTPPAPAAPAGTGPPASPTPPPPPPEDGGTNFFTEVASPSPSPPSPAAMNASDGDSNGGTNFFTEVASPQPSPPPMPMNASGTETDGGTNFFTEMPSSSPSSPGP